MDLCCILLSKNKNKQTVTTDTYLLGKQFLVWKCQLKICTINLEELVVDLYLKSVCVESIGYGTCARVLALEVEKEIVNMWLSFISKREKMAPGLINNVQEVLFWEMIFLRPEKNSQDLF